MDPSSFFKNNRNRIIWILSLVYGLVLFNVGALILYEKFSQPTLVYDRTFGLGFGSLILGIIGLIAARRIKKRSG